MFPIGLAVASIRRIAVERGTPSHAPLNHFTEYFVNAPPAWLSEFGPSAA